MSQTHEHTHLDRAQPKSCSQACGAGLQRLQKLFNHALVILVHCRYTFGLGVGLDDHTRAGSKWLDVHCCCSSPALECAGGPLWSGDAIDLGLQDGSGLRGRTSRCSYILLKTPRMWGYVRNDTWFTKHLQQCCHLLCVSHLVISNTYR